MPPRHQDKTQPVASGDPQPTDVEQEIARLAAKPHGLLTVVQLAELELSRKVVARRVAKGHWIKLHTNVLRVAGTPITWESQVLANVFAAGEGAVASHRCAAVLWRLDGVRRSWVEITVPRGRRSYRPCDVRIHYSTDLDRVRSSRRSGVPCTSVERTLLDLGAVLPESSVLLAVDSARRQGLTDWESLLDTLVTHARRGRAGVGTLRAVLDQHLGEVAMTDSGFERLVLTLLLQEGLPRPVLQHDVSLGDRRYRLDLAYPESMVAIELDGSVHLERRVWEADHLRQNALMLHGWTILRFTWKDYRTDSGRLVREVGTALGHR